MSCEFFEQWLSLCYSSIQLGLMKEISNRCCMHSLFHLSHGTLKLFQSCQRPLSSLTSTHGHSVVEDGLLWAETAVSRLFMDPVSDCQIQIIEKRWNISPIIFIIDWCSCLKRLTTRLWSCLDFFYLFVSTGRSEPELSTPRISRDSFSCSKTSIIIFGQIG